MKTLLNKVSKLYNQARININLNMTANALLKHPDSSLKDIGVSRHLLIKGAKAYPWKEMNTAGITSVGLTSKVKTKITTPANANVVSAA
jgi:hypothetical protein